MMKSNKCALKKKRYSGRKKVLTCSNLHRDDRQGPDPTETVYWKCHEYKQLWGGHSFKGKCQYTQRWDAETDRNSKVALRKLV